jgi:hypothetical protein
VKLEIELEKVDAVIKFAKHEPNCDFDKSKVLDNPLLQQCSCGLWRALNQLQTHVKVQTIRQKGKVA